MISPELLRRYPFFGYFNEPQLVNLAMLAEEFQLEDGQVVFEQGHKADSLYFLLSGGIDLYYSIPDSKQIPVCEINVGEPFGISTLIEPHILTSTARSSGSSRVIRFSNGGLKRIIAEDPGIELLLLRQVATTAIERLYATRTQLAAALS
jgi:CRP/FNR family transcriptional regulator